MERSSRWMPWSSLGTLKLAFNISSEEQGSHPDNLSVWVCWDKIWDVLACIQISRHFLKNSMPKYLTVHWPIQRFYWCWAIGLVFVSNPGNDHSLSNIPTLSVNYFTLICYYFSLCIAHILCLLNIIKSWGLYMQTKPSGYGGVTTWLVRVTCPD